jgi:hypothetical protein
VRRARFNASHRRSPGAQARSGAQPLRNLAEERVDVTGLRGVARPEVGPVHAPPAHGLAQRPPVGRLVAGPPEADGIDQGLQEERPNPVALLPGQRQLSRAQGENVAGQVGDVDPR